MKIIIESYSPKWLVEFAQESKLLKNAFNEQDIKIEHIGSTSVKGLGAKPIVDIMIGLSDFSLANHFISTIESLGYSYISKFENVMPQRRFFTKELAGKRTHHIHMVELNTEFWKRHLGFRDYLRNNPEVRNDYLRLKLSLAEKEWKNENEYAEAKTEFIQAIEKKAMNKT